MTTVWFATSSACIDARLQVRLGPGEEGCEGGGERGGPTGLSLVGVTKTGTAATGTESSLERVPALAAAATALSTAVAAAGSTPTTTEMEPPEIELM